MAFFCVAGIFAPAVLSKPASTLFPDLDGWKKGEIATWTPDTLYQPIDGAADLFLRYHFEEMDSVEYSNGSESFTVEVYRHATPTDAFGPYSQGLPEREVYLDIGVQGYADGGNLNFLAGRHYIEMRSLAEEAKVLGPMKDVARRMAAALNEGARFPAIFGRFPEKGRRPHSERYLARDVLGYACLPQAFAAEYTLNGGTGTLQVLPFASEAEAKETLAAFLREEKHGPVEEGVMAELDDRYQGRLQLLKSGRYLLIVSGSLEAEPARALIREAADRLKP